MKIAANGAGKVNFAGKWVKTADGNTPNSQDPLWKRRSRLPSDRVVSAVVNEIRRLLGPQVRNVEEQAADSFAVILNGSFESVQSVLQAGGWKPSRRSGDETSQIEVLMLHPEWHQVEVIHWAGKNGHELDISSLGGDF